MATRASPLGCACTARCPRSSSPILSATINYGDLPGIWTLLGGLWILHFSYWGFNQYIIQRALGAKSLGEAQTGLAFSFFLKLLMPLIIVLPGIAAYVLAQPDFRALNSTPWHETPDRTYPELMSIMPGGLRGLIFAALLAAIDVVAGLNDELHLDHLLPLMSIAPCARTSRSSNYVLVGHITAIVAIVLALFLAQPLLGSLASAFQVLQEYTGFVAPGVVAVFLTGMFWRRTTHAGAGDADRVGPGQYRRQVHARRYSVCDPIWVVFLLCLGVGVIVSLMAKARRGAVGGPWRLVSARPWVQCHGACDHCDSDWAVRRILVAVVQYVRPRAPAHHVRAAARAGVMFRVCGQGPLYARA